MEINNKKLMFYSILRYKNSLVTGEILNLGVLYYFTKSYNLYWRTGDLKRVNEAYPEFDFEYIKLLINHIKERCEKYKLQMVEASQVDQFIHENILLRNDNAVQFDEPKLSLTGSFEEMTLVEQYSGLLLQNYKPEYLMHPSATTVTEKIPTAAGTSLK